ncbi:MAG: BspA family leucine-rich repeat surface protein [Actinomycetota bacterium]
MTLTYDTTGLATPTIPLPLAQVGAPGVDVDWGDGTTSTYTTAGNRAHTFPVAGTYTVQICGTLQTFGTSSAMPNVSTPIRVDSFGTLGTLDSLVGAFVGATNLVSVPSTLPTSVTKIPQMFQGATKINDPNIALWDTSRITNMSATLTNATSFNQNLSGWSQAANQTVANRFGGASKFNNGCAKMGWQVKAAID